MYEVAFVTATQLTDNSVADVAAAVTVGSAGVAKVALVKVKVKFAEVTEL